MCSGNKERILWQYWENSSETPNGIPYIDLCHASVDKYSTMGKGYAVKRLTPETVRDYIDLDPILSTFPNRAVYLAQKADYIRAKLLAEYGGVWLDSDAIVLGSMDSVFDKLDTYSFFGYQDDGVVCVWALASRKGSSTAVAWRDNNEKVLHSMPLETLYHGELGHKSLELYTRVPNPDIHLDPAILVQSLNHTVTWKYLYGTEDVRAFILPGQPFFMTHNFKIDDHFRVRPVEWWRTSNIMLAQLFRITGVV